MEKRVEKHIIKKSDKLRYKKLWDWCFLSKNLYNYGNYKLRQVFIATRNLLEGKEISIEQKLLLEEINKEVDVYNKKRKEQLEFDHAKCKKLDKEFKPLNYFNAKHRSIGYSFLNHLCYPGIDYQVLPSQTSQQILKVLVENWKSFFEGIKKWKSNPDIFTGRPKPPKYKHKTAGQNIIIFTNQQARLKGEFIYFPDKVNLEPIKTRVDNLQQVRIIPGADYFTVEVVYNYEPQLAEIDAEKMLLMDFNIDNFMACYDVFNGKAFIINGKLLKSINQYYNKEKARLMSYVGDRGFSNKISRLTRIRNMKVDNFIHQATALIRKYCIQNKIGVVVIGQNKLWKQNVELGKKNNQKFVTIPFNKAIKQLQYKLSSIGINVILTEESYTSKVDHFAFEDLKHHENYLGRRTGKKFKSSTGKIFNADIHGAIGIGRKVVGDELIQSLLDRGVGFTPIKLDVPN